MTAPTCQPVSLYASGRLTATEVLSRLGYSHRAYARTETTSRHEIVAERTGRVVARLCAWEVQAWVERLARKLEAIGAMQ